MREEPRSGGENSSEEPVSGPGCIVQVTRQETGTRGPVMRIVKRKAPYGGRVSAFPPELPAGYKGPCADGLASNARRWRPERAGHEQAALGQSSCD